MHQPSPETLEILECLRKTVYDTLDRKRRLGHYAVVCESGEIKKLTTEEIAKRLGHIDDRFDSAS